MKSVRINEEGNRYGKWTVVRRSDVVIKGRTDAAWDCICDCGTVRAVSGGILRRGLSKSCGCGRFTDKIGNRYNKLTVLKRDPQNNKNYICECDCGNIISIKSGLLQPNKRGVGSCGCLESRLKVSIGDRFGKLVVIRKVENSTNLYECLCDCGNTKEIKGYSLIRGRICCSQGCSFKIADGEASFNMVFGVMKKSARVRGYSWELNKEQVKDITQKSCYYCGAAPSRSADRQHRMNGDYVYNGLDRVNNEVGYEIGNVVPCCWTCNRAKATMTIEQFRGWITSAYSNFCAR